MVSLEESGAGGEIEGADVGVKKHDEAGKREWRRKIRTADRRGATTTKESDRCHIVTCPKRFGFIWPALFATVSSRALIVSSLVSHRFSTSALEVAIASLFCHLHMFLRIFLRFFHRLGGPDLASYFGAFTPCLVHGILGQHLRSVVSPPARCRASHSPMR